MDPRDTKFYVGKLITGRNLYFVSGRGIDPTTGSYTTDSEARSSNIYELQSKENVVLNLKLTKPGAIFYYDKNKNFIDSVSIVRSRITILDKPNNAAYFAILLNATDEVVIANIGKSYVYLVTSIKPHYKGLTKKYKKESQQQFFRESINGDITLVGNDYLRLYNYSLEDKGLFIIAYNYEVSSGSYKSRIAYSISSFTKMDVTFNSHKNSCSMKLTTEDDYTAILDGYKDKYDIVKLAPAITPIDLHKRAAIQVYVQGSNSVTNIFGNTVFETQVSAAEFTDVDLYKYSFGFGVCLEEVYIPADRTIDETYHDVGGRYCGKYGELVHENGLYKLVNANPNAPDTYNYWYIQRVSDSKLIGKSKSKWKYSTTNAESYKKEWCVLAVSTNQGGSLFTDSNMEIVFEEIGTSTIISPDSEFAYAIYSRLLTDDDFYNRIEPNDPFANGTTYRACFPVPLRDEISISLEKSDTPTKYGLDENGKYFVKPYNATQLLSAIGQSVWAYASIWLSPSNKIEQLTETTKVKYTLKHAYSIGEVIKVLLNKIAPHIKHEPTKEYSQFLYGDAMPLSEISVPKFYVYITPKSNILKGDYDQAAQKGEASLEDILAMLRDCFKCYWYLDGNKLKIEHIYYFMNGGSYNPIARASIDLTEKFDKFNGKSILYGQSAISYDKSSLIRRYEFSWMDNATELFTGQTLDIMNTYIPADTKEEVSISNFSADIDYMLLNPADISSDGFALLCPIKQDTGRYELPIDTVTLKDENANEYMAQIQNYYASWNFLVYLYMYSIGGNAVKSNTLPSISAFNISKCMTQEISFIWPYTTDPDIIKLIKTTIGEGQVEELEIDVDSRVAKAKLVFSPM